MTGHTTLPQAIIETLQRRAAELGDGFLYDPKKGADTIRVRCFRPEQHKNGDAHPSAVYHLGKYVYCKVCGFKEGEKKLADRLGIGVVEGGLTLQMLAEAKHLPADYLQKWGWRTQQGKDRRAKVLIPWFGFEGVEKHAPAYHIRHFINKDDDSGPRFTWDKPRNVELLPYGCWRLKEWLEEAENRGISPGPGEDCFDLEKLLSSSNVERDHLDAVRHWLDSLREKS